MALVGLSRMDGGPDGELLASEEGAVVDSGDLAPTWAGPEVLTLLTDVRVIRVPVGHGPIAG